MSDQPQTEAAEEKIPSVLPHFARAAAWAGAAFCLALGSGMAPLLFPHQGGYVLLGVLAGAAASVFCITRAALAYGDATACHYAKKGISFPPQPQ
jgi:hypothetical protein